METALAWGLHLWVTRISEALWIKGRVKHIHPDAGVLWPSRRAQSLSITGGQEPAPAAACAAACGGRAQPGSALARGIHLQSLSISLHAPWQRCNFTYWSARWVIMPKRRQVSAFQIKCCYLIHTRQSKRVCLAPGLDTGRRRFLVRRNERLVLRQKPHLMERNWCYLRKSTGWLWSQMFPSVYDKSIVLQCCRKSQISLLSLLLPESSQLTSGK